MTTQETARLHERLDQLFEVNTEVQRSIERIEQRCQPCRDLVQSHTESIHGNGKEGLLVRMAKLETNTHSVDRLSVKGMVGLVGAVGGLAAAVGGAMAAIIQWLQ